MGRRPRASVNPAPVYTAGRKKNVTKSKVTEPTGVECGTSSNPASNVNEKGLQPRAESDIEMINEGPEPIPIGATTSSQMSNGMPSTMLNVVSNEMPVSMNIEDLIRKRKFEVLEAAESIARIQEEEEKRKAKFEKTILELQRGNAQSLGASSTVIDNGDSMFPLKETTGASYSLTNEAKRSRLSNSDTNIINSNNNRNDSQSSKIIETSEPFSQLAQAFAQAIQSSSSAGNEEMRKFVARQAHPRSLSTFSGDPEDWPTFISEFHSSNLECKFSDAENMARLKNCLSGRAKDAVKSMMIIPENINQVIRTLEVNFGRPELIIATLIQKIHRIPKPTEDQPNSFLCLSNSVLNLVSTMELLEETGHMMNPQLLAELEDKLPVVAKVDWSKSKIQVKGPTTLLNFSTWLQKFSEGMSRVGTLKHQIGHSSHHHSSSSRYDEERKNQRGTILSIVEKPHTHSRSSCPFCGGSGHFLDTCSDFLSLDANSRWEWVKNNRLCFTCLRKGHTVFNCMARRGPPHTRPVCGEGGCRRAHHRVLHNPNLIRSSNETVAQIHEISTIKGIALLKVMPIKLRGPQGEISAHAFLDDGSTTTLLDKSTAHTIGAFGPTTTLNLRWTNKDHTQRIKAEVVSLFIVGADGEAHRMDDVKSIPGLSLPCQFVDIDLLRRNYDYLQQVDAAQMIQGEPKILIGQAHWDLIQAVDVIRGPSQAPALSKTKLGWVLHGIVPHNIVTTRGEKVCSLWQGVHEDDEIHQLVKRSFSTDDFGVKIVNQIPRSKNDIRAQIIMDKTARRVENHWEIGLLWRDDQPKLPESKSMALQRLYPMEKKMDRDPQLAQACCSRMEENENKGYARKLSPEEAAIESPLTWYLPYFIVTNPNKPGKIRIVFDAAAKSHGKSLNDFLLKGPDQLCSLINIIFVFRQRRVAFGGDIKEMFSQIKIRKEDCAAQRFLWRGMDRDRPPSVYEFTSMFFGAADSSSKSQEIKNRNAMEFQQTFPAAVNAIINLHFMDDYYDSKDTDEESSEIIRQVIHIHKQGGFQICNWVSNSKSVLATIPSNLRANAETNLEISDMPSERVLGVHWNPNQDIFIFLLKFHRVPDEVVKGERRPTKREVLKLVMSIFDPLGLIAHLTVRAKILLQDIWRSSIGWDDQVPNEIFSKWVIWLEEFKQVTGVKIPRCYCPSLKIQSIQLHIFCDASEKAFASVAYFRFELENGEIQTALVMAKTRVAPLRPLTIPRLELQAAVMGSRLSTTILNGHDLPVDSTHLWTDSQTVLKWLQSDARRYNAFVAHRVGEIMESTNIKSWNWLPSEENVADDATRDDPQTDLKPTSRWFTGPSFLKLNSAVWPKPKTVEEVEPEQELKVEFLGFITAGNNPGLPDPQRFSSWTRLIRATARVLRIFQVKKGNNKKFTWNLTSQELEDAEKLWWRQIQLEGFAYDVASLKDGKPLPSSSRLFTLSPYLDEDNILRVKGRTVYSPDLPFETTNPIILDPQHYVTKLLIHHFHLKVNHHGQEQVMNEMRQKFWILSMRAAIRGAWNSCLVCKIRRAEPQHPQMAPLPSVRVTRPLRPFSSTGIDFFGPLEVTERRKRVKRYGVIFVCLTTRAVHLELASSLSTDSTLLALQRFIELRAPEKIYSDNGTNFRGASKELRQTVALLDYDKIQQQLVLKKVQWSFIPPAAPHMGGSWESLIKSVRTALSSILKEQAPREEVLRTLLAEAQGIVNGHPLTHVSIDPSDPESLTPNHFLIGASSGSAPRVQVNSSSCISKQWKVAQKLADGFWKRWIREYLPSLTRRTKWFKLTRPIQIGDLVLVADNNQPRNHWPRGVISKLFPGKDGIIRVVEVKTCKGEYRRPVSKICVLDVRKE